MASEHQEPWQALSQCLRFPDSHRELWWHRIAPTIGCALRRTNNSVESQLRHLLLIHTAVTPFLGPYPGENSTRKSTWRSCIAGGDGAPMDVSVNYQQESKRTFRMNFEPIGAHAGMDDDPLNQHAARDVLSRLSQLQPGIDLTWYFQLEEQMILRSDSVSQYADTLLQFSDKTQVLFGLDLSEESVVVKAYFFPLIRATVTGADWMSIMFDSVRTLSGFTEGVHIELGAAENYLRSIRSNLLPEHSEVGFDCIGPAQSRIKIYAARKISSVKALYDFYTFGHYLQGSSIERGFEIISSSWHAIYSKPLPNGKPRTHLQIHCNWEVSATSPVLAPKVYFLVAEELDAHVSSALADLFHELGWHENAESHESLTKEAYPAYDPQASTGIYTWLAFAYSETSGPYVTVYFKPPALADDAKRSL
ncbi:aromatic prenyltransferase [Aspergillus crustosus]